jgi:hypothetical protein
MEALGEKLFANLILVIRDSCHALRIAMKDPLHHDKLFGKIWEELFNKKGAVVQSFQYSDKLKALLVAAQRENASPVSLHTAQPLAVVLESFSFAKQRFDSTVDPAAKLSLMLLPVATVLAFVASDTRIKTPLRQRARRGLEFLDSKNCVGLGISADWGIVWEAFLRLFDAGDHDIACSSEEIEGLIKSVEILFLEGAVFQDCVLQGPVAPQPAIGGTLLPPVVSHSMAAAGVEGQFISTIVKKHLGKRCVFNVNGDPVVMWGALPSAGKADVASRIKNVAKVSIGRLRADFPTSEMRFFLRAFNMSLVQDAFAPHGEESKQEALTRCCQAALKSMRCPEAGEAEALLEYKALATGLAGLATPGQPLATKTNREIWGLCLDPAFLGKHLPGISCTRMQDLVRFYESILDGSCGVERGLAKVRASIKESHHTTDINVLDDVAVLVDTTLQPWDLAKKVFGFWEPGEFGLECGVLWREVLGARMGIYNGQLEGTSKNLRPGTYKSVKAGVFKAIGAATCRHARQPSAAHGTPSLATALASKTDAPVAGTLAAALAPKTDATFAGTPKCPHWHKGFSCTGPSCQHDLLAGCWGLAYTLQINLFLTDFEGVPICLAGWGLG